MRQRFPWKTTLRRILSPQAEMAVKKVVQQLGIPKVTQAINRNLLRLLSVEYRSAYTNIYHCSAHKAASQWIKAIFRDHRVYKYSGLMHYNPHQLVEKVEQREKMERIAHSSFPPKTIVSPLYITFEHFQTMAKPENYKCFFTMRDPRDIVVSWYFSMRYSHGATNPIVLRYRKELCQLSLADGLLYTVEQLCGSGEFEILRSWCDIPKKTPKVKLFKFEDLTASNNLETFAKLFQHCDILIPEDELRLLLKDFAFEQLAGGRKQGNENLHSHYRKGVSGEWKEYFDQGGLLRVFEKATGDLVRRMGYE